MPGDKFWRSLRTSSSDDIEYFWFDEDDMPGDDEDEKEEWLHDEVEEWASRIINFACYKFCYGVCLRFFKSRYSNYVFCFRADDDENQKVKLKL